MFYRDEDKKENMLTVGYFQLVNTVSFYITTIIISLCPGQCNSTITITTVCCKTNIQQFHFVVSICHLERHCDDGGGEFVCPHTRCSFTSHAPGVWHDDKHICGLWAWGPGTERSKQGVHQQYHLLAKWLHLWNSWKQQCPLWVSH